MLMLRSLLPALDIIAPANGLRELWNQHRWLANEIPSLRKITERRFNPAEQSRDLLTLNTWLMNVDPGPILNAITDSFDAEIAAQLLEELDPELFGMQKPLAEQRAQELGSSIGGSDFDIVLLQEVFQKKERNKLLDSLSISEENRHVAKDTDGYLDRKKQRRNWKLGLTILGFAPPPTPGTPLPDAQGLIETAAVVAHYVLRVRATYTYVSKLCDSNPFCAVGLDYKRQST